MARHGFPKFFADRIVTKEEALKANVVTGTKIATGFATSEPSTFYACLWDHIQREDLADISIRQALFMAPHRLCLGDALSSKGLFHGWANGGGPSTFSIFRNFATWANSFTKKAEGLGRLIDHYRELQERRIEFVSAFLGATSNIVIPSNPLTRLMYPEFAGRNPSRMGIVHMQSVHFPEAVDAMAHAEDGSLLFDLIAAVLTPPDENGEMSHGVANGATGDMLDLALKDDDVRVIVYVNGRYPFTRGYGDAPNTIHIDRFKRKAKQGKLFVVEDDAPIPALPPHSFDQPSEEERKIAEHVVNHIEMNRDITYGRAVQVGIGGSGVLAIRRLLESSWRGRSYTEMLEPFTLALFEAGKVAGSHFIERNGLRTPLDGKLVCTFTLAEQGSGFYEKLHNNPSIVISTAARVVVSEGFCGGLGVNNILGIDFQGHVNSGGRDKNHYSGIGGAAAIARGLARGGVSYLCLKSTHRTTEGKRRSSIFPYLPQGTPISLIGPDLMGTRDDAHVFLVTEHGVARINGAPQDRFIRNIISVAHPDYRDWLWDQAWEEFRAAR
jgi:acyl-CoA hydrolase